MKAKEAMQNDDFDAVAAKFMVIEKKIKIIDELNTKIQDSVSEDKIAEDIDEAVVFEETISGDVLRIKKFMQAADEKSKMWPELGSRMEDSMLSRKDSRVKMDVYLPKIDLKTFTGDPIEWQQFYDLFVETVDKHERLSEVQKLSYLIGKLGGAAARCVEGIPVTNENYGIAMKLLQERFGNAQLVTATHIGKLLNLEKVKNGRDIKEVRDLFDQIEGHVRCLVSGGVNKEEIGPLLIPMILDRLPDDVKLQVSRNIGKSDTNWHIEEFMKTIKDEIVARENCDFMKSRSNQGSKEKNKTEEKHITTESLLNNTKVLSCVFCKKNHFHDQCRVVTDPQERKEIAKREKLCYKCLNKRME